jgi:hypothetical protein
MNKQFHLPELRDDTEYISSQKREGGGADGRSFDVIESGTRTLYFKKLMKSPASTSSQRDIAGGLKGMKRDLLHPPLHLGTTL